MKRFITLMLVIFCIGSYHASAQKQSSNDSYKYLKAAEILDNNGDLKEARKLLTENIDENPSHVKSYLLLATMDRKEGDYSSALRLIDKALKNNHKKSEVSNNTLTWWKAVIYDEMDDLARAIPIMEQVVKIGKKEKSENLISMYEDLAQFYYSDERYEESDKVYKEMIKLDETQQLPFVGLARNMCKRERFDEALKILDDCAKLNKNYYEVYRWQMVAYEGLKDYRKMIDAMMALFDKSDDTDYIRVSRFKKDYKYSVAVLKERIATADDKTLWKMVLTDLYAACSKYSQALSLINELIDEYGADVSFLSDRATYYEELGLTELALKDMDQILEMCKESQRPYYQAVRSDVLRSAGKYEEAMAGYSSYIDRFPTDAYGYYARGWCKELSGDDSAAFEDYNEGIAVDESYPYIYLMRGEIYLKRGMNEQANLDFEQVVKKDTIVKDGTCRHYALHFLGRDPEALEWIDKLIETDVDSPGHWYDKSCLLSRMGKLDESVAALKTAFEKGYRKLSHLEHDDDMDPIRNRDDYKQLIEKYQEILAEEVAKFEETTQVVRESVVSEIALKKTYGGTYEVPCEVNGLPLKMIFDTGAADVTISSVEASFMLKNGYLTDEDIKGKRNYVTASGDIHEGTVIRLKAVKLGEAVLKNVEASVVNNQRAPLLLGQSVLEKFGTITVDNVNSKLLIKQ